MLKLGTAISETHARPHFASHTQSSLMKRRTPMKLKKKASSSMKDVKRSEGNVILSGIHKRRSNVMKQSRSMQMMIMILKQQRDRRSAVFLSANKVTEMTCRVENSLISFQSDLIKDVSHDLKSCTGSPAKLTPLHNKSTKVINESEKHAENSQNGTDCTENDNLKSICVSPEDSTILDIACKLELHSSNEEELADPRCVVQVLHRRTESGKNLNDIPNEDYSEIETQIHLQDVNAATDHKRMRKIWTSKKVKTWNKHVDVDRASCTELQNFKSTKRIDNPQNGWSMNDNVITQKKGDHQKNFAFHRRAWKPPGVSKTWITESATSLQPVPQKSIQSAEKSTSSKNKHSSTEHVETHSESTSTAISTNQFKILMKENRDPRANRMTKICEHLVEVKQRQRLQSGGAPKKQWSKSKIGIKVSDKCDDTNSIELKNSKSRHCQIMPKKSSYNSSVEQDRIESTSNKRTLEVIHSLKKIIDSVKKDEDVSKNSVNNDFDNEKDESEIQTSSNRDVSSQNNELCILMKDVNLDGADQSSRKSVSTQTKLDLSYQKVDAEKDQDLKKTLKLARDVATQTPNYDKNVVEIGCNTSNIVCNDMEVTCDSIDFTNSKTEVDPVTTEDKSASDGSIHTDLLSVKHIEINENEDANENKEPPLSECKETLNIEMSVKLESSVEISTKATNDTAIEAEKIMNEETCQISLNFGNEANTDIDKHQESIKHSKNHDASTSVNDLLSARSQLSIYNYNASCSSSAEVTEYPENDIQYKDMVTSDLKVKGIPSDVMAAFELAAERARNLHKAIIIYRENLMSKKSKRQNKETIENNVIEATSGFRYDRHCLETHAPFISRENEAEIRSEFEAISRFANDGEDFDRFSTCSSRVSSFDQIREFESLLRSSNSDYFGIDQEEENAILPENKQARAKSILNECPDFEDVKSLMQSVHRKQKDYALELFQLERDESNESFERAEEAINKLLALSGTNKKTCFISRENLFFLICCVVCTVVFWFLQFSYECDSTK